MCVSPGSALKKPTFTCLVLQVTHSAHYFQQLCEYAVKLIETGNAYVDHQTAEEVKLYRLAPACATNHERPVKAAWCQDALQTLL